MAVGQLAAQEASATLVAATNGTLYTFQASSPQTIHAGIDTYLHTYLRA